MSNKRKTQPRFLGKKIFGSRVMKIVPEGLKFQLPEYRTRYSKTVTRFADGIEDLRRSSKIMHEIFDNLPSVDHKDADNNTWYEAKALFSILETIDIGHRGLRWEDLFRPQKVYFLDDYELDYLNSDGILICWRRSFDNKSWNFWICVPSADYSEPLATETLGERLEARGFKREEI